MNKLELIQELKVASNLSKSETDSVVSLFFNEMTAALTNGDRVEGRVDR